MKSLVLSSFSEDNDVVAFCFQLWQCLWLQSVCCLRTQFRATFSILITSHLPSYSLQVSNSSDHTGCVKTEKKRSIIQQVVSHLKLSKRLPININIIEWKRYKTKHKPIGKRVDSRLAAILFLLHKVVFKERFLYWMEYYMEIDSRLVRIVQFYLIRKPVFACFNFV